MGTCGGSIPLRVSSLLKLPILLTDGLFSDFHAVLRQHSYQASSIHSRRRLASFIRPYDTTPSESPPPPPPPPPTLPPVQQTTKWNSRTARENRLLSNLWSMSAATFRRLGKIEQAKGAIQEAEVRDEGNPAVWVQVGAPSAKNLNRLDC